MTSPSFRHLRRAVYALKRAYGQPVSVCRTLGTSVDLATGIETSTDVQVDVRRAVVLPAKSARAFFYDLSYIAANKNFTYGGMVDQVQRIVIVDRRDLPSNFVADQNTFLVVRGRRMETKKLDGFEEDEILVFGLTGIDQQVATGPTLPPYQVPGAKQTFKVKTSDYQLVPSDSGLILSTSGAVAPVTFTLPPWASGLTFPFANGADFLLTISTQEIGRAHV